MGVDVLEEALSPGVEDGGHAEPTTQAFGVGDEGLEAVPGSEACRINANVEK